MVAVRSKRVWVVLDLHRTTTTGRRTAWGRSRNAILKQSVKDRSGSISDLVGDPLATGRVDG